MTGVQIDGIVETVVTTRQPDRSWNIAALGVWSASETETLRARTWGDTRTRRNFERTGEGVIHLTVDPVTFARAALEVWERESPTIETAAASCHVDAKVVGANADATEWELTPAAWAIHECVVPTPNRGFGAVVEMTVAASRLGVPEYDDERLRERLSYFHGVAHRCGGPAVRSACDRIVAATDWEPES